MIYDHKNRQYELDGCSGAYTYITCVKTGDKIKVASHMFNALGFSAMPVYFNEVKR